MQEREAESSALFGSTAKAEKLMQGLETRAHTHAHTHAQVGAEASFNNVFNSDLMQKIPWSEHRGKRLHNLAALRRQWTRVDIASIHVGTHRIGQSSASSPVLLHTWMSIGRLSSCLFSRCCGICAAVFHAKRCHRPAGLACKYHIFLHRRT